MKEQMYFWVDGQVEVITSGTLYTVVKNGLIGYECVDTSFSHNEARQRYGKMLDSGWFSMGKHELNKEFLMHLLLMGVS